LANACANRKRGILPSIYPNYNSLGYIHHKPTVHTVLYNMDSTARDGSSSTELNGPNSGVVENDLSMVMGFGRNFQTPQETASGNGNGARDFQDFQAHGGGKRDRHEGHLRGWLAGVAFRHFLKAAEAV
jgi:hypothetical protein